MTTEMSPESQSTRLLRVAVDGEMKGLDPNNLIAGHARRVAPNFAPGLLRVGNDWSIEPCVALSWQASSDGTRLELTLDDIQYHSGRKVTGTSVVDNFRRVRDPAFGAYQRSDYSVI